MEFIESSAKTIEEATKKGLAQLEEMNKEFVKSEIISTPSNGIFGFGKKDALVRMYYNEGKCALDEVLSPVDEIISTENVEPVKEVVEQVIATTIVAEVDDDDVKEFSDDNTDVIVLTPEKQAEIANKAKTFLQDMLETMGLTVVIEKMTAHDRITFQVHGENLGILIGKHGQTLEAIQYLTNLVANKGEHARCHIMVDVGGYRERRERTLQQLAKKLADKVKRNRHKMSLEPMNAYERKIIHTALQDTPHISTNSEGEGASRHIVIEYVK